MIRIAGMAVGTEGVQALETGLTPLQIRTLRLMANSAAVYPYDTLRQLRFELRLREEIVRAARKFNTSKVGFATFQNTRGNRDYWQVTAEGGIRLKAGVLPSAAIEDIFINGRKYAMECATAKVAILYKAVLDTIGSAAFNQLFQGLYLYDWHFDKDLGLRTTKESVFLPGDILYFDNPDFDPNKPQWRGENVVDLGNGLYYGHPIGIGRAELFISFLNRNRKPGATRSAYLLDQATRPDFRYLSQFGAQPRQDVYQLEPLRSHFIIAQIGTQAYIA